MVNIMKEVTIVTIDDIRVIKQLITQNKGHFAMGTLGYWIVDSNGNRIKKNKNYINVPDKIVAYFRARGECNYD